MDRPTPIPISDATAQRRADIFDAWTRYDGEHPASISEDLGEVSDNVTLNNLATIIDTGVDFLFGGAVTSTAMKRGHGEDGKRKDEEVPEATERLDDIWESNSRDTFLRKLGIAGGIEGHYAVKIRPALGPDKKTLIPDGEHRVTLLDTGWLTHRHAPGDIDTITGYAIDTVEYDGMGNATRVRREQHDQAEDGKHWIVQWLITEETAWMHGMQAGKDVKWVPDPDRPEPAVWPFPFAAIVDSQNLPRPHSIWGRSDLTKDILGLQEAINRVASNEQKTLRHFAHPRVWGSASDPHAMRQAILDTAIGEALILPEGDTLQTLEMQAEGPAAAAKFRHDLEDKLFEIARTPRVTPDKLDGMGAMAGVALLILYRPLIAKTETKRDTVGDLLRELDRRLLWISGHPDLFVELSWPEVLPKDEAGEISNAQALRDLGVSLRSVFERLGIPWEQEQERMRDEADDPMGDARGLLDRLEELQARLDAQGGAGDESPEGPPQGDREEA